MANLDVVTLQEAKARLQGSVAVNNDDDTIQEDITGLSAMFDQRYGAVVQRAVTGERVHPNRRCNDWADLWPVLDDPAPTVDVGTIEVVDDFGMVYFSDPDAATIGYTAGRFATTDDVDEQFKSAFYIALRNWRQASVAAPYVPTNPDYPTPRQSFPTFAVPRVCDQMLGKYRRHEGLA